MKLHVASLLLFVTAFALAQAPPPQYDVLIRNGKLVDGTGNPWVYADIGINGDRITFIGHAAPAVTAKRTIDAKGLIVAPGFIDMLGQSETNLLIDKQAVSKLTQGITTEITGEGDSIAPLNDKLKSHSRDFTEHFHITLDWQSLDEYFRRLEKQGSGINLGTYVGAAQLRDYVIGKDDRAPTADELESWLRDRLASFKVPRRWLYVDELPLTASGKVQKYRLRQALTAGGAPAGRWAP